MIDHVRLQLPDLPDSLVGLRIAHVTDTHFFQASIGARMERLLREASREPIDLAFLTGDFMDGPGDEPHAARHLATVVESLHPKLGFAGVFGNHDTLAVREMLRKISAVHWLENRWLTAREISLPTGLAIAGLGTACTHHTAPSGIESDGVALASSPESAIARKAAVRLVLSHKHIHLPLLADMRATLVFSGHTHGGQCRMPVRWNRLRARALINSTDWPLHLTSGVMLHRRTLAVVSRGMGETTLRIRAFCPIHMVIVELARGHAHENEPHGVLNIQPW